MCSIATPSEPVVASLRSETVKLPTAGSTVPGQTVKVRRAVSSASTSQTRCCSSE